jgi:hypothetical protein
MLVWARRDGDESPCSRPRNGEIGSRGLRWKLSHLRVAGKIRGKELESDADKAERQRLPERAMCDSAHGRSSILRGTVPAPRVRGSVDRLAVFDVRLSDADITGDGDICLLPPLGDAEAREAGQREKCHQDP